MTIQLRVHGLRHHKWLPVSVFQGLGLITEKTDSWYALIPVSLGQIQKAVEEAVMFLFLCQKSALPNVNLTSIIPIEAFTTMLSPRRLVCSTCRLEEKLTKTDVGAIGVCKRRVQKAASYFLRAASGLPLWIIREAEFHNCTRAFPQEAASWQGK